MKMDATTTIARPVDTVFAYVSNVSNDVHWRTGVTESGLHSDEPLGLGSTGYARAGDVEAIWRVISFTDGTSVDWELVDGPLQGSGGYRLVPVDGGTRFTLVADIEPSGVFKLMGPLFAWMGRRRNQADVEKLRETLESTPD
jgi:uncharacterized membrane protein